MNWLTLDKYVWRLIFRILNAGPLLHCWYNVCSLRAVCRFMRDVSLIKIDGLRWVFRCNPKMTDTFVRSFVETPIQESPKYPVRENKEWKDYIKKRRPVFPKTKPTPQSLESVSWCEPNERTKKRGPRRSHHQKKPKVRGDFRRSGPMYEQAPPGGYIRHFGSPLEVNEHRPWAVIECVITEIKDYYNGAVTGKYISERLWKDPITCVIYYRQKYFLNSEKNFLSAQFQPYNFYW